VSNFEHVNFAIDDKYSKNHENPNYHVSFVIFQTYKNAVLKMSVHLGGSFDYDFTLLSYVVEDAFIVVDSIVKNSCKVKNMFFLPFNVQAQIVKVFKYFF
jgi:hypothetical protein